MQSRRLSLRTLLVVLVAWAAAFGAWRLVRAPQEAKSRLEHLRHVIAVVGQYAREHGGAWPAKWEEIEKTALPEGYPPLHASWEEVRKSVVVDFSADPAAMVRAGPDAFAAIAPRGVCPDYRADVEALLAALASSGGEARAKPAR